MTSTNNQTNTKTYYIVTRKPFELHGRIERWNPDIFSSLEAAERHIEVKTCDGKIDRDEYTITTRTVTV